VAHTGFLRCHVRVFSGSGHADAGRELELCGAIGDDGGVVVVVQLERGEWDDLDDGAEWGYASTSYHSYLRPASRTAPNGSVTTFTYGSSVPYWTIATTGTKVNEGGVVLPAWAG
jgi:hypothetical protein